jgi:hypothetical protein
MDDVFKGASFLPESFPAVEQAVADPAESAILYLSG